MGHKTIVSPRQLLWGVILCLVCSSLISPAAGAARLPAWGRILAAAASAALVWLLLLPFMAASGRERFVAMLAGYGRGGKVCLVLFSLCFALAAGRGLERTETFYRYVSPDTLPLAVFVAEGAVYARRLVWSDGQKPHPWLYSLGANAVSLAVGWKLMGRF